MNVRKRITTLLLTICLVLSLVPAVSAADETQAEYNFDYYAFVAEMEAEIEGADGLPAGNTNVNGSNIGNYASLASTDLTDEIENYYESGDLNWKFLSSGYGDGATGMKAFIYSKEFNKSGRVLYKDNGFARATVIESGWIAFTIKNPGAGEWSVSLEHLTSNGGAELSNLYILDASGINADNAKSTIPAALAAADAVGSVRFYNSASTQSADAPNVKTSTSQVGLWTFGTAESYIVVLRTEEAHEGKATGNMYPSKLVMSKDTTAVKAAQAVVHKSITTGSVTVAKGTNTATYCASDNAVVTAINSAASGDRIILLNDVTSAADITIPAGVTLDLNGKTLNANVNDAAGTLVDSSGGDGKVKAATLASVGSDQMVLADGDYLRIFDYTLTTPTDPVEVSEDGDSVQFWFDVRFDNAAAYDVIAAGNSGFSVGANFQWNENAAVKADFGENLSVEDWAAKMKLSPNYSFYVKVAGLKNAAADGTLTVLPTVSGKQGAGSITSGLTHTVSAAQ